VTGSSSGIGKAIALRFGEEGATVIVTARRLGLCQETADQITSKGGMAWAIQTDVTDERQVERLFDETINRYGHVDILVNNAGIFGGSRLAETSTREFDEVINVNLRGTFFCCRAGFRRMKQQSGGGVILNMSSVAGVQAWAGTGVYSASKHGIMALTKALADEGRPYNITLRSAPSARLESPMNRSMPRWKSVCAARRLIRLTWRRRRSFWPRWASTRWCTSL
jgi:3-oxoacyl-[acyl-carrier protein] reductase